MPDDKGFIVKTCSLSETIPDGISKLMELLKHKLHTNGRPLVTVNDEEPWVGYTVLDEAILLGPEMRILIKPVLLENVLARSINIEKVQWHWQ